MTYELITQYNSRNFTPAALVPATYGRVRTIDSITIHWWGLPEWGATFEGTTDFLCTNTKPTSAHEVIEAGRVAVIVNHADAAWAAGNAVGNATSIHLELNPRAGDADYETAAERIRDIREMYGTDLPLIPHRDWQATMCPGVWDLARLDDMARASISITTQGTITPSPTLTEEEPLSQAEVDRIYEFTMTRIAQAEENIIKVIKETAEAAPAKTWSYSNPNITKDDAYQDLRDAGK